MKNFLYILFLGSLLIFSSCGKDQLSTKKTSSVSGLSGTTCSCNSTHSPVCGVDGKDYDNACLASCYGQSVKKIGHCDCSTNTVLVCGSDGQDHTECEATAPGSGITIVKFVPCASTEL